MFLKHTSFVGFLLIFSQYGKNQMANIRPIVDLNVVGMSIEKLFDM